MEESDMTQMLAWGGYQDEEDRRIDEEVESEPYFPTPDEENKL